MNMSANYPTTNQSYKHLSEAERGTNENFNGLLRKFIPKWSSLKDLEPNLLKAYTKAINESPRQSMAISQHKRVWDKSVTILSKKQRFLNSLIYFLISHKYFTCPGSSNSFFSIAYATFVSLLRNSTLEYGAMKLAFSSKNQESKHWSPSYNTILSYSSTTSLSESRALTSKLALGSFLKIFPIQ